MTFPRWSGRRLITSCICTTAAALLIVSCATQPPQPGVEFYITGDAWNGNVVIEEPVTSGATYLGTIGGMRLHSLRISPAVGYHVYRVRMPDSTGGETVGVNVEPRKLIRVNVSIGVVKSESRGRTVVTYFDLHATAEPPVSVP